MTIKRRRFLKGAAAGAAAGVFGGPLAACADQNKRPNILFIMADDLGFGDLSCFGRPDYETPNLDRLAQEGLKLSNTYSNSAVCSPTRTALLTGNYQYRLRVGLEEPVSFGNFGVPQGTPTIASEFLKAGYNTALVGKWHLGAPPDYGPIRLGYEHFMGFYPGGVDYFSHTTRHGKVKLYPEGAIDGLWLDDKEPLKKDGYLTDVFADETQKYIEAFAKEDKPFFLSLHFSAPHWPWEGPNDIRRSRDLTTILDKDGGNLKIYAEMVKSMDANIGRVLDKLHQLDLDDNTIVVFTSDNGGERFSYNWPFIGKKGELLEGGIRVPGIMRWPAQISGGKTLEQVITSMDWMPTLLAAANNGSATSLELDGKNLLAELLGTANPHERELFWRFKASEQAAARSGDWKYLKLKDEEFLFNLKDDQREQANLKESHAETFARLKTAYAQWNENMLPYPEDSFSHATNDLYTDRY